MENVSLKPKAYFPMDISGRVEAAEPEEEEEAVEEEEEEIREIDPPPAKKQKVHSYFSITWFYVVTLWLRRETIIFNTYS